MTLLLLVPFALYGVMCIILHSRYGYSALGPATLSTAVVRGVGGAASAAANANASPPQPVTVDKLSLGAGGDVSKIRCEYPDIPNPRGVSPTKTPLPSGPDTVVLTADDYKILAPEVVDPPQEWGSSGRPNKYLMLVHAWEGFGAWSDIV
jgi:hypothetical protein